MIRPRLEIFDKSRKLVGILQNAYNIREEISINAVNYLYFSLPYNDIKNELCQPFYHVRYDNGDLYRVLSDTKTLNEEGDWVYKCEHVLALLIDSIMFGQHVVGNIGFPTRRVIEWLLERQNRRFDPWTGVWTIDNSKQINWVLGECDFSRQFEYGWEQETLLSALFSVANRFVEPYIWTWNTKVFPYVLNLKQLNLNRHPQMYIRSRKNLLSLSKPVDLTRICTRIYPLGEGEGVNQLNIRSVNGGVPFLQSPPHIVAKYGIIERNWTDRRYQIPESLMEAAQAMLNELQEPHEEYNVEFALLGKDPFDLPEVGKVVEIVDMKKKTYITGITFNHDEVPSAKLTIANKPKSIAGTVADMMDRQRIEMTYSQGATQIFQDHLDGNAEAAFPLQFRVMFPSSMKIINSVMASIQVSPFRVPFRVMGGAGAQTISQINTTSSGASSQATTVGGGEVTSGASSLSTTVDGGQVTSGSSSITTTDGGGDESVTTPSGGGVTSDSSSLNVTATESRANLTSEMTELPDTGVIATGQHGAFDPSTHNHGLTPSGYWGFIPDDIMILRSRPAPGEPITTADIITKTIIPSGAHRHANHRHTYDMPLHSHGMNHTHWIPNHQHTFWAPRHSHGMNHTHQGGLHVHGMAHTHTGGLHTHGMAHTHGIEHTHQVGDHEHQLDPGIRLSGNPSSFIIRVNGVNRATINATQWTGDITPFLLNTQNRITRDSYYRIEIVPNTVAYVQFTATVQGFVQSRGDRTV